MITEGQPHHPQFLLVASTSPQAVLRLAAPLDLPSIYPLLLLTIIGIQTKGLPQESDGSVIIGPHLASCGAARASTGYTRPWKDLEGTRLIREILLCLVGIPRSN